MTEWNKLYNIHIPKANGVRVKLKREVFNYLLYLTLAKLASETSSHIARSQRGGFPIRQKCKKQKFNFLNSPFNIQQTIFQSTNVRHF